MRILERLTMIVIAIPAFLSLLIISIFVAIHTVIKVWWKDFVIKFIVKNEE
jgi:hypothetical protein